MNLTADFAGIRWKQSIKQSQEIICCFCCCEIRRVLDWLQMPSNISSKIRIQTYDEQINILLKSLKDAWWCKRVWKMRLCVVYTFNIVCMRQRTLSAHIRGRLYVYRYVYVYCENTATQMELPHARPYTSHLLQFTRIHIQQRYFWRWAKHENNIRDPVI